MENKETIAKRVLRNEEEEKRVVGIDWASYLSPDTYALETRYVRELYQTAFRPTTPSPETIMEHVLDLLTDHQARNGMNPTAISLDRETWEVISREIDGTNTFAGVPIACHPTQTEAVVMLTNPDTPFRPRIDTNIRGRRAAYFYHLDDLYHGRITEETE